MSAQEATQPTTQTTPEDVDGVLNFLWLELTNRCNLRCVHCYTDSHPLSGDRDVLTTDDYGSVMGQAYDLGCRQIQLIGGEPQLHPAFNRLMRRSVDIGFDFVEVFTNLTTLDEETLAFSAEKGVHFATSVYSDDPAVHDAVTTVRGSHRRTVANLRRLVEKGVRTRVGVIAVKGDAAAAERTRQFLLDLGVDGSVRTSEVREFGRGQDLLGQPASLSGLCGHCWNGNLAVAPDGKVFPCVMARDWAVGDVLDQTLEEILHGDVLAQIRREIHDTVWREKTAPTLCPQCCVPDLSCPCDPLLCTQSCEPLPTVREL
ncbi:radical SAM protein [Streptomyces sp. NBC_01462]|uniref:radical SAM protein n=1 Tax=Streptomyces sp. NBC_01462 TaxID=2903876 RepID=UPI002E309FE5|nr:radical SAM protein [Streptomyces sp. NBC_01462]